MANAKLTGIDNLISLEVCPDPECTCRQEIPGEPDFARLSTEANGRLGSRLYLSSEEQPRFENSISIPGVPRQSEVKNAFDECTGVITIESGEVICGAIARLRKQV
jgi:hypothetical protein